MKTHPYGLVNGLFSDSSMQDDSWEQKPSHTTVLTIKYFKYKNPLTTSLLKLSNTPAPRLITPFLVTQF